MLVPTPGQNQSVLRPAVINVTSSLLTANTAFAGNGGAASLDSPVNQRLEVRGRPLPPALGQQRLL